MTKANDEDEKELLRQVGLTNDLTPEDMRDFGWLFHDTWLRFTAAKDEVCEPVRNQPMKALSLHL